MPLSIHRSSEDLNQRTEMIDTPQDALKHFEPLAPATAKRERECPRNGLLGSFSQQIGDPLASFELVPGRQRDAAHSRGTGTVQCYFTPSFRHSACALMKAFT